MRKSVVVMAGVCVAVSVASAQVVLPEGTRVKVRLEQPLSSATAEEGQAVNLSVVDDVKVGETVVIPQGSACVGQITQAVAKRRMGRTGKLDFSIERVVAADGSNIPLRYSPTKREGGSNAMRTGILTAAGAVVFWPAAPVFLLMKGKDVTINRGLSFDVFTDQRFTLAPPKPVTMTAAANPMQVPPPSAGMPAAPIAPPAQASVTIKSDPEGAEIEVDGAFVGSTPTTMQLAAGPHAVSIKKGAQSWTRTVQVQGGSSITLDAPLARR